VARGYRNGLDSADVGPKQFYVSINARDASRKIMLGPYTRKMREYVYAYLCQARGYRPKSIKIDFRDLDEIEWDKDVRDLRDLLINMLPVGGMACPLCGSAKLWTRKGLDPVYFCWNCRYEFKVEVIRGPEDQNIVAPFVRERAEGDEGFCISRSRRKV
jgi:hypothetical protein